jgi:hypothetical protein
MSPLGAFINIAIVVAILGITVYWVRRFAVFRGYKDIQGDVLRLAELLKTQPVRERADVVVAGYLGWLPTIVRFSKAVDTPGLHLQMRMPATFNFTIMPKTVALQGEGRVVMRTGNASLDKKFTIRSDHPLELHMLLGTKEALQSLEQLCCSSQTGVAVKGQTMELSELTIPRFTANHVLDHLHAMTVLANRVREMPGASQIRLQRLPPAGAGWTIRVALAAGLLCLIALLFAQPYNRPAATSGSDRDSSARGASPIDTERLPQLQGWHVASGDEIPGAAATFLRVRGLPLAAKIVADFSGRGTAADSAYLLIDPQGQRRVTIMALGGVAYDAIFPRVDALARIPKASVAKIKWKTAPQFSADGDGLLVIQNADDPTASLVLLRHGIQTYSARPADFSQIDLALQ